jgi:hypothetical protein
MGGYWGLGLGRAIHGYPDWHKPGYRDGRDTFMAHRWETPTAGQQRGQTNPAPPTARQRGAREGGSRMGQLLDRYPAPVLGGTAITEGLVDYGSTGPPCCVR